MMRKSLIEVRPYKETHFDFLPHLCPRIKYFYSNIFLSSSNECRSSCRLTNAHHENIKSENLCIIYEYLILYDRHLNHM